MNVADAFGAGLLVITGLTSAFRIADAGLDYFTPPPVEGSGYYSEPVRAGETVLVKWDMVKRTGCPGYRSRVWDGTDGYYLSEANEPTAISPRGERTIHVTIPTRIPETAPIGPLTMRILGVYCPETDPQRFTLGPVNFEVVE